MTETTPIRKIIIKDHTTRTNVLDCLERALLSNRWYCYQARNSVSDPYSLHIVSVKTFTMSDINLIEIFCKAHGFYILNITSK